MQSVATGSDASHRYGTATARAQSDRQTWTLDRHALTRLVDLGRPLLPTRPDLGPIFHVLISGVTVR